MKAREIATKLPFALSICIAFVADIASAQPAPTKRYFVFDGKQYAPDQLDLASRSPVQQPAPYLTGDGSLVIPRAANGHYYVSGSVNGFPVLFLIDTGASHSTVPGSMIRNVGIRTGLVQIFNTAAGQSTGSLSKGNIIKFGPFTVTNADIGMSEKLAEPLLGMSALGRFQFTHIRDHLVISRPLK